MPKSPKPPPSSATVEVILLTRFYFFAWKAGAEDCIISAHGGYQKTTKDFTFTWPGTCELRFYGPHGLVLSDPGIGMLQKKNLQVHGEPVKPGDKVTNYILSKYQESGSRDATSGVATETFTGLVGAMGAPSTYAGNIAAMEQDAADGKFDLNDPVIKRQLADARDVFAGYNLTTFHVITIRNRLCRADVNLEQTLETIKSLRPGVKRIHCSFCRSFF
jgi:hypothetical protein